MIENKTFVVTGSSSGIGKSITNSLLLSGANVIGISRTDYFLKNQNYKHIKFDLTKLDQNNNEVNEILKDKNIFGLISNAGNGSFQSLENFSTNQINRFISLNLIAHILMTKSILPILKRNNIGFLIYIGSEAAFKASKYGSIYSACKFGLRGFAKSIRQETSNNNIKVTLVNPGIVKTPFYDDKKIYPSDVFNESIDPDDISKVIIEILNLRDGTVVDEVNISSQKNVIKFKNKL